MATKYEVFKPDLRVFDDRYRVTSLLAESAYSVVYEVIDSDCRVFAMKVQRVSDDIQELSQEFATYRKLLLLFHSSTPVTGIPCVYGYAKSNGLDYLIMERLGESLEEIANKFDKRQLDKKDVLMIGIQVVLRLQYLHKNGILHRDVKPQNLLMGIGPNAERTVHLVDFGAAITVEDWNNYEYERKVPFVGTEYYAAVEALSREAPTRRGDLESLCYTLSCLAYGDLPWIPWDLDTGLELPESEKVRQRVVCKPESLSKRFSALEEFVRTVLQMSRRDEPDYEHLIKILEDGLSAEETTNDGDFEWLISETEGDTEVASASGLKQEEKQTSHEEQQKAVNDYETKEPTLQLSNKTI